MATTETARGIDLFLDCSGSLAPSTAHAEAFGACARLARRLGAPMTATAFSHFVGATRAVDVEAAAAHPEAALRRFLADDETWGGTDLSPVWGRVAAMRSWAAEEGAPSGVAVVSFDFEYYPEAVVGAVREAASTGIGYVHSQPRGQYRDRWAQTFTEQHREAIGTDPHVEDPDRVEALHAVLSAELDAAEQHRGHDWRAALERVQEAQPPSRPSGPVLAHGTLDGSRRWVAFGDLSGSIPEALFQQVVAELAEQRRPLAEARRPAGIRRVHDVPGNEGLDPLGLEAIERAMAMGDLRGGTHRFANRTDERGRMVLWQPGVIGRAAEWGALHRQERVVGAFVETGVLGRPTIAVVSAVLPDGSVRVRAVVDADLARAHARLGAESIVEESEGLALVEARREWMPDPVHELVPAQAAALAQEARRAHRDLDRLERMR